ncbi:hypothetical protein [Shewanella benthica]|uniref:hypothetical protein n=1 Tax=Shewanella benthica TaxID=43661 RepID=UPI00030C6B0F|nr:hypothetical protein [Shewanella benthica]
MLKISSWSLSAIPSLMFASDGLSLSETRLQWDNLSNPTQLNAAMSDVSFRWA